MKWDKHFLLDAIRGRLVKIAARKIYKYVYVAYHIWLDTAQSFAAYVFLPLFKFLNFVREIEDLDNICEVYWRQ